MTNSVTSDERGALLGAAEWRPVPITARQTDARRSPYGPRGSGLFPTEVSTGPSVA
ncbi:MAG: hypothetical protein M3Q22_04915 [Actinomycetota bacterium]|nr:hypothetical protein [Actinomycetota bacterium]